MVKNDTRKSLSIYLIKATRKPHFVRHVTPEESTKEIDELARNISLMQDANLAVPGISIQLVESIYDEEISKIEIGGLEFNRIPKLYQHFGY